MLTDERETMATPQQIIPKLEGMVGYMIGSADGGSVQGNSIVTEWVKLVKLLLEGPNFRYLTDFEFVLSDDVDSTGVVIDTSATHFIAGLIETAGAFTTDATGWVGWSDADSDTVDFSGADDNDIMLKVHTGSVAATGVSEFTPVICMAGIGGSTDGTTTTYSDAGISLAIGLTVAADGDDGTEIAADAVRVWTLYRT